VPHDGVLLECGAGDADTVANSSPGATSDTALARNFTQRSIVAP
jgi:hypothetical protein